MEEKILNTEKHYWVIVRMADPKGYQTGKAFNDVKMFSTNDILELDKFLADQSVESCESMGAYYFEVLAMHPRKEIFHQMVKDEEEEKELRELFQGKADAEREGF